LEEKTKRNNFSTSIAEKWNETCLVTGDNNFVLQLKFIGGTLMRRRWL